MTGRMSVANRASVLNHADAHREVPLAKLFDAALWVFTALIALIALILAADWMLRAGTFPVQAVRFEGEFKRVTQAELEAAVMGTVRGNFLRLDLEAVKAKVERLPWVQSASVRRAWPRDVYVQFTEQRLLARWNADAWVNQALDAVRVPSDDPPRDMPLLEGPEGTQAQVFERYRTLSALLAASGMTLRRLTLTPRRTWRLELDGGLVLVLDREEPEQKVGRFAHAWPWLARERQAIRQVDLRYTNGFAVQWVSGSSH